tara:strand:- start:401 stop:601 length:201 start_codon:yes stop_codon:yes gene_type:complete
MKKVGILLILTFAFNLIGQVMWIFDIFCEQPLFGSKYLWNIIMLSVYTISGICGLLSGITLYNLNK